MRGQTIIVTSWPKGTRDEGILGLNAYPGTKMEIKNGVLPVGGRHTWVPWGTNGSGGTGGTEATGDPRPKAILLADELQGAAPLTQLIAGQNRAFLYFPLPGEDMNILCAGEAGTGSANAFFIGTRFIAQVTGVAATNGLYIVEATSSISADFMCKEHIDEVADAATLVWCQTQ